MNKEPERNCIMKYHLDLGQLLDMLTILQLKEVHRAGELKEQITQEIEEITHDINVILTNSHKQITAEFLRDLIILSQFNNHIWNQEDFARKAEATATETEQLKLLKLTHSLNGIRVTARNRLQNLLGGRKEKKVDCYANNMADEFKEQWIPSSYI